MAAIDHEATVICDETPTTLLALVDNLGRSPARFRSDGFLESAWFAGAPPPQHAVRLRVDADAHGRFRYDEGLPRGAVDDLPSFLDG